MKTLTKKKKKIIVIAVVILLVVAIASTCIGLVVKDSKKQKVSLYTVGTGTISESVGATGKVTSGTTRKYAVSSIAKVKEVFVKTGDVVKKGDTLATFDTADLDEQIVKLRKNYDNAKKEYNQAVADQKQANRDLAKMDEEISALQKSIEEQRKSISSDMNAQAESITKLIARFEDAFNGISDDEETVNKITQIVMNTISEEIKNGNTSPENIASSVEKALNKAVENGEINPSNLNQDITAIVEMIRTELGSFDWSNINMDIANNSAVKLTSDELRLAALTAQREIYGAAGSIDLVSTRKELMEASKSALDMLQKSSEELRKGWVADFDGTITSCDIKAGDQTSALTPGITLQNTNQLVVTISIGEYDINKIQVGMPAEISTAYGKYTGSVISKAPTASGSSSSSLIDSIGSMAGIGGLSSLTDKGAGVEVVVSVDNPDENIIIGFNADVDIDTGDFDNIVVVPVEAIRLEKTGTYVFLYDEKEGTVTKTKIETGATSAAEYQVVSGLSAGDRIVDVPKDEYNDLDETFDVKVNP